MPPDLPEYRVDGFCNSFTTIGQDNAGPLIIKENSEKKKVYILLFTCATTRAVHLELTPDLSEQSFLRGFKRFTSRRGTPSLIIQDNASTFKSKLVKEFMLKNGVTLKFILAASPWWGGFYERLVKSVKLSLRKVLGKAILTFEELQTVLCEIEAVINGRPLVYQSEDEMQEVITPFNLMFGRNLLNKSVSADLDNIGIEVNCKKRMKYLLTIIEHYWNRFRHVYFFELRQQHLYRKPKDANNEMKLTVGDTVLICDDKKVPRSLWSMGRIEKLIRGNDGKIRGVDLKVMSKGGKASQISRPLQKIIPFEIANKVERNENNKQCNEIVNTPFNRQCNDIVTEPLNKQYDETVTEQVNKQCNEIVTAPLNKRSQNRPRRKVAAEGEARRRLRNENV